MLSNAGDLGDLGEVGKVGKVGNVGDIGHLREHGYRVTTQRQLVLRAVQALEHPTPETILAEVQRSDPGVNLSTVYRTLDVLEEVGLVTHAHLGHRSPAYHSADEPAHIHLICRTCHSVLSVQSAAAEPFARKLAAATGFTADLSHMTVQGTCGDCSSP